LKKGDGFLRERGLQTEAGYGKGNLEQRENKLRGKKELLDVAGRKKVTGKRSTLYPERNLMGHYCQSREGRTTFKPDDEGGTPTTLQGNPLQGRLAGRGNNFCKKEH